jgi:hypothetical protein
VRDENRFHCFKEGLCSCKYYWSHVVLKLSRQWAFGRLHINLHKQFNRGLNLVFLSKLTQCFEGEPDLHAHFLRPWVLCLFSLKMRR